MGVTERQVHAFAQNESPTLRSRSRPLYSLIGQRDCFLADQGKHRADESHLMLYAWGRGFVAEAQVGIGLKSVAVKCISGIPRISLMGLPRPPPMIEGAIASNQSTRRPRKKLIFARRPVTAVSSRAILPSGQQTTTDAAWNGERSICVSMGSASARSETLITPDAQQMHAVPCLETRLGTAHHFPLCPGT